MSIREAVVLRRYQCAVQQILFLNFVFRIGQRLPPTDLKEFADRHAPAVRVNLLRAHYSGRKDSSSP